MSRRKLAEDPVFIKKTKEIEIRNKLLLNPHQLKKIKQKAEVLSPQIHLRTFAIHKNQNQKHTHKK